MKYSRIQPLFAIFWLVTGTPFATVTASTLDESLAFVSSSREYTEIKPGNNIKIDLRYAVENNFVGVNLYGKFNRAFLHKEAAEKLKVAAETLGKLKPGYRLVIFDALRPRSVQNILWEKVKGTAQQPYVANPVFGSIHNYGFAVDISIVDEHGAELDMGTPFDDFSPLAQPQLESRYLAEGKLTESQLKNRHLLREVMQEAGFIQLPIEWWHYDALPKNEVKKHYKIVE